MNALKDLGIGKLIEDVIKEVGPRFFGEGANGIADKIGPIASKLLKAGSSDGAQLMHIIKEARQLRK